MRTVPEMEGILEEEGWLDDLVIDLDEVNFLTKLNK